MSNKLPLISVIIPIYNVKAEYLSKCIESIINQTLQDIEIILIDDGSRSECKDLCDKYSNEDDRIVVIHKNNEGVSKARNDGIALAKGKWIAFVDGDDWVEKNYLEELYKNINKDVDVVICDTFVDYTDKQFRNKWYDKNGVLNKDDIKQLQLQIISKGVCRYYPKYMSIANIWGRIYSRNFLLNKKLKYAENLILGEDKLFNLYAFEGANKINYIGMPLYHYRNNDSSTTHKYDLKVAKRYYYSLVEIQKFIDLYNKDEDYIQSLNIAKVLTIVNLYMNNYLFNEKNKDPFWNKKNKFKKLINEKSFRDAMEDIDKKYLNISQKLTIVAIKLNSLVLIKLIYIIKKINNYRKGKIEN